ncbi:MAG: hypothetical protein KDK63_04770 [Chlamydiia bacterium]|nr:hypothetical protein [Chlamydiia bacterium]
MMKSLPLALAFLVGTYLYGSSGLHARGHHIPVAPTEILSGGDHLLYGKGGDGKVQIEDGTLFDVHEADASKVSKWKYGDVIAISPNPYPGGGSEFYITHAEKKEYVHANLYSKPNRSSDYTLYIYHLDPFDGHIELRSKDEVLEWQIEKKDLEHIGVWEEGDRVIIGKNDMWYARLFSSCRHILVNCDKQRKTTYLRIKPYVKK